MSNSNANSAIEQCLVELMGSTGACCCTFYLPDPRSPDSLELICMPGVKYREPMVGFVFPDAAVSRVTGLPDRLEEYFFDTAATGLGAPGSSTDKARPPYLYGNFINREGIQSSARLRSSTTQAVLWINFREKTRFPEELRSRFRNALCEIDAFVPRLTDELKSQIPTWLGYSSLMLRPTESLTTIGKPLSWYLEHVLNGAIDAFKLRKVGIGTIHLYSAAERVLKLKTSMGQKVQKIGERCSVDSDRYVIAWVAKNKRALYISDLEKSDYKNIYVPFCAGMVTELAVPMMSGNDVLGVINLESSNGSSFDRGSVRALWYAANQAAVAVRLFQQAQRTSELLSVAHVVANAANHHERNDNHHGESSTLSKIAHLGRKWLDAADCDIWEYHEKRGEFGYSGATYTRAIKPPRKNGWSEFIKLANRAVFIDEIKSTKEFRVKYFGKRSQWVHLAPPNVVPPDTLNAMPVNLRVSGELGLPLRCRSKCVGVAWFKFKGAPLALPSKETMNIANGFAAQAGLVIDIFQRSRDRGAEKKRVEELCKTLFCEGEIILPDLRMRGFVCRHPCGDLGGDFHAIAEIKGAGVPSKDVVNGTHRTIIRGQNVGLLIGDAESHSLSGGLKMLPLITTFRIISKASESTKHTLLEMRPICYEWELRSTALYITFNREGDGNAVMMFGSNVGHPRMMVFRGTEVSRFPSRSGGMLGGGPMDANLTEEMNELEAGDIIVAFTDGISEAGAPACFGEHRIASEILDAHGKEPREIAEALHGAAQRHAGGKLKDDATIIVLKVDKP